jgi:hypothetical protein
MSDDGDRYYRDQFRRLIVDAEKCSDAGVRSVLFTLAAEYHRLARAEATEGAVLSDTTSVVPLKVHASGEFRLS